MSNTDQTLVMPVENIINTGLLQRFGHVFGCRAIFVSSNDKTRQLKKTFEGGQVEYPYAFLQHPTIVPDETNYSSHMTTRVGLPVIINRENEQRVRLLPATFEYECEFICSSYEAGDKAKASDSVLQFTKRWYFARRMGQLKFNIEYGALNIRIGCEMSNLQTPLRGNATEEETEYKTTGSITVKGYLSEPLLKNVGVVQELEAEGLIFSADGSLPGAQFMSFNQ